MTALFILFISVFENKKTLIYWGRLHIERPFALYVGTVDALSVL